MPVRQGKCINFGNCPKADSRSVIEVPDGAEFVCPEVDCGKALAAAEVTGARKVPKSLVLGGGLLIVVAAATWALWPRNQYPEEPTATVKQDQSPEKVKDLASKNGQTRASEASPCGLKPVDQPDVNRLLTYLKQGMTYASQSRYDLALKEFEQVQKIDPNFLAMHENIAAAQLKLTKLPEAEAHLREELKLIGCLDQTNDADLPKFAYMLEVGQKGTGDADAARAQTMRERLKEAGGVAHYNLACVRARQGSAGEAVAELRQAVEKGFSDVSALNRDPDLAMVRSAPGFQDVVIAASTEAAAKRR